MTSIEYNEERLNENVDIKYSNSGTINYKFNRNSRYIKYVEYSFGDIVITRNCLSHQTFVVRIYSCEDKKCYQYKGIVLGRDNPEFFCSYSNKDEEIDVDNCVSCILKTPHYRDDKTIKIDREDIFNMNIDEFRNWLKENNKNIIWEKPSEISCSHIFKNGNQCKSKAFGMNDKCKRHAK